MRKVVIGCGVALGLAVLGTVLASILAVRWFRTTMPDVQRLEERQEELADRFGDPEDYLPPLDGRVDPARIEAYLRVREGMPALDGEFGRTLVEVERAEQEMEEAHGLGKVIKGLRLAQQGMGVAAVAMRSMAVRDSLLLVEEMGLGEYYHLTGLGPLAWLEWDPPECTGEASILGDEGDEEAVLRHGRQELARVMRRQLERVVRRLETAADPTPEQERWGKILQERLVRGRIGSEGVPLEGELPDFAVEAWRPYRQRLEASLPPCRELWLLELVSLRPEDERGVQVRLGGGNEG